MWTRFDPKVCIESCESNGKNRTDLFFSTSAAIGDPVLWNLELAVRVIVFSHTLFRFRSCSDVWVSWEFWLIGVLWRSSYAISGRGEECIQKFFSVDSGKCVTRSKCSSFCCMDFSLDFLNCTVLWLSSTQKFITLAVRTITRKSPGSADAWNEVRFSKRCVCCVLSCVHLPVWFEREIA